MMNRLDKKKVSMREVHMILPWVAFDKILDDADEIMLDEWDYTGERQYKKIKSVLSYEKFTSAIKCYNVMVGIIESLHAAWVTNGRFAEIDDQW